MEKHFHSSSSSSSLISGHMSTKSSKGIEVERSSSVTTTSHQQHQQQQQQHQEHQQQQHFSMKIFDKTQSFKNSPVKLSLTRTCLSTDDCTGNLHGSKTSKKPLLIRAEAIDLLTITSDNNNTNSINNCNVRGMNSKMKHHLRSHLFVSFFVKHFEKMQKKISKRPLGSSLSFDLDERQRMHALQQHLRDNHNSLDNNIIPLSMMAFNCFHCHFNVMLHERKSKLCENGIHLWSSSDIPTIHYTHYSSSTNFKSTIHDSTFVIKK